MTSAQTTLHALLFRRREWYIAQCLEHDIAVQARSFDDARYEFERALLGRLVVAAELGCDPFAGLPKAPLRYWRLFEEAAPLALEEGKYSMPRLPQAAPHLELRTPVGALA